MTNKKIASEIAVGIILLIVIAIGGIFWVQNKKAVISDQQLIINNDVIQKPVVQKHAEENSIMCPQNVKLCEDGKTFVSRTGPNCEFAECPAGKALDTQNVSPLIEQYDIKEFTFADSQKISKIEKQPFKVLEHFSVHDKHDNKYNNDPNLLSIGLSELGDECLTKKSDQYYADLLSKFNKNDLGIRYKIYYKGESNMPYYLVMIIPNKPIYSNTEQFKEDFGTCYAGGNEYPNLTGEKYLLFVSSCGSGFGEENDLPYGCDEIKEEIESTLKVF